MPRCDATRAEERAFGSVDLWTASCKLGGDMNPHGHTTKEAGSPIGVDGAHAWRGGAQMPTDPWPDKSLTNAAPEGSARGLVGFFVLTFVWSWGFGLLAHAVLDRSPGLGTALQMVSGFGPSLAAVVVVARTRGGAGLKEWLKQRFRWRHLRWRWIVLAFGLPPVLMALALGIESALGGTIPASPARGHVALAVVNFGLVFLVGGPLGEELGWRGHALPALAAVTRWRAASLLVGVIWGLWHLPLFFMAEAAQSHMPIGLFFASTVAQSVILGALFMATDRSVVPVMVMHTSINAWLNVFPVLPTADSARPFALVVGLQTLVALLLLSPWSVRLRGAR